MIATLEQTDVFSVLEQRGPGTSATIPVVSYLYRRDIDDGTMEYRRELYRVMPDGTFQASIATWGPVTDSSHLSTWASRPCPSPSTWVEVERVEPDETIGEFRLLFEPDTQGFVLYRP